MFLNHIFNKKILSENNPPKALETVLMQAAKRDDLMIVKELIEKGSNINIQLNPNNGKMGTDFSAAVKAATERIKIRQANQKIILVQDPGEERVTLDVEGAIQKAARQAVVLNGIPAAPRLVFGARMG